MIGRHSARAAAQAPVKYTSDSETSDFGDKKSKGKKKVAPAPKKGIKRSQSPNNETVNTPKRRKKSPGTLAFEYAEKSKKQEEKAAKQKAKQQWEDWLSSNDVSGKLLVAEPEREDCITQTDAQKRFGLKANELISLEHFEKPNQYGSKTKLFLTKNVEKVAFRKLGLFAGLTDEQEVMEKGEELWKNEHTDDTPSSSQKPEKENTAKSKPGAPEITTYKRKWAAYVKEHSAIDKKLSEEPQDSINQTDSQTFFQLVPQDLVCLPYFPKPNPKYGNTTKLFNKTDVENLAYRKAATIAGVEDSTNTEFLEKGKKLFERTSTAAGE